jgi:hypothetical protein
MFGVMFRRYLLVTSALLAICNIARTSFASTTNYALNRPVTVSSTYQTFYGSNAVDGVVSDASRWLGTATSTNNWIAIDLASSVTLQQAHVYSGFGASGWITNLQMQAWSGTVWTNIPGAATSSNSSLAATLNFSTPVTTAKIRLLIADTSICRLREITLWDQLVPLYTGVVDSNGLPLLQNNLMARAISWSEVALRWSDTFSNETGFVVERMAGTNGVWLPVITATANVTDVRDCGLAASTTYSYRVNIVFSGISSNFAAASVTTLAASVRPPILVLPLGDSITLGASVPAWVPGGYRDPLFTLLTNAGYQIQFVGSDTNNPTAGLTATGNKSHEGHGSYTTSNLLANLDAVAAGPSANNGGFWLSGISGTRPPVYPDVILLMAGVNDLGVNQLLPTQGLAGLDALLTKLTSLRPSAWIIVSTLTPYIGLVYPVRESHEEEFNAALSALVAAHQAAGHRVLLCDVRTRIDLTNAAAMLCSDGVHPNQTGYDEIASMWFDAFQKLPLIENWRKIFFGSPANAGSGANTADADGDGSANIVEFVLGTNPTNAVSANPVKTNFLSDGGTNYLSLTFPRRKNCDVACLVEVVPELSGATPWTNRVVQVGPPVSLDANFEQVTFRDSVPMNAAPMRFMRLKVQSP